MEITAQLPEQTRGRAATISTAQSRAGHLCQRPLTVRSRTPRGGPPRDIPIGNSESPIRDATPDSQPEAAYELEFVNWNLEFD
jgi:hypothetical protein